MLSRYITIATQFAWARWRFRHLRGGALQRFQNRRAQYIVEYARRHAPYYRERFRSGVAGEWGELPTSDKRSMMAQFDTFNTRGISKGAAMELALEAENSRDFRPKLSDLTVGLSSGTSGHRGLFLVSPWEQAAWVGAILARIAPGFRLSGYRVALFHRSNSNLYEQLHSRWLTFRYFDLMTPLETAIAELNLYRPDIVVGPPSLLGFLADAAEAGTLQISPLRLISVAEVMEYQDRQRLEACFRVPVHQIYLCTEGLLAISCPQGSLHVQEDIVALQAEPLAGDDGSRITPIITDLWRTAQPIIRYRLNDILTLDPRPCACGSDFRVIAQIEGRCDDVFFFTSAAGKLRPVFPDTIRRMVLLGSADIIDYQAYQDQPGSVRIHVAVGDCSFHTVEQDLIASVRRTLTHYDCDADRIEIRRGLERVQRNKKRRRVQRLYEDVRCNDR